jgi:hypothetical protein
MVAHHPILDNATMTNRKSIRPRRETCFALLCAALVTTTGCRYLAVQAYAEVRGAQGVVHTPSPVSPTAFNRFRDVEFQPARSEFSAPMIPSALLRSYDDAGIAAIGRLRDKFPGGEPTVRIAASFLYFQSRSFTAGAEAIARVQFFDGSSMMLDSIVRAESESFRAGDEVALAHALVDAIIRLLRGPVEPDAAE